MRTPALGTGRALSPFLTTETPNDICGKVLPIYAEDVITDVLRGIKLFMHSHYTV